MSHRPEKVEQFIKEEVMRILQREVRDPRIGFVSVTDVEVSVDLRHARVFVSVLGDPGAKTATMEGLHSASRYIRRALGRRLQMRYTPDLTFTLDESIERGSRVLKLLGEVKSAPDAHAARDDRGDPAHDA
ncbi:MAG: 30S ribosome-binding factor RbfA [Armatimonadota bacterium]|nr:30S ribosome-binding factor RbfA [Armatimonadota bacterium]MDR7466572.1 30S ribosome-binding factor RbfA [Armatimonadota bacterium]MDR7495106.1 30S ribosome-binding factor RbfA [Armatimonadota bacterium]MDR7500180.1 30S ribosome-binding factor RbfA [Armatimonadota bacterium]MDR7505644.1 30S ribosome-binding factor RbfA [Armatimonadota bacterium]